MLVTAVVLMAVLLALTLAQLLLLTRRTQPTQLAALAEAQRAGVERLDALLREEQRAARRELAEMQTRAQTQAMTGLEAFGTRLKQLEESLQRNQETLRATLIEDARKARSELAEAQHAASLRLGEALQQQRQTLETRLAALQNDNAAKLEQMRATVDEKLQATLEQRLGQSFALVSERLEAVQRGLGEMRELASGVGDLKRVLGNVKQRGIFGEVQLAALLQDMLSVEQYQANVATVPGSGERVEFAVRMPGQDADGPLWLPIDAKFPLEDYQRLLDAQDAADADAAAQAGRALETRVREEARRIRGKYVAPPHTTDFAVLYLPTEGLYAEVIRRPGLFEQLQRDLRITVAGPTTLSALLNSLQMGFRTLAIAQRSSEVWKILGAVKTEFGKFGDVLDKVKRKLDEAGRHIDATGVRTRAIARTLREVETLDGESSRALLQLGAGAAGSDPEAPGDPDA